MAPQKVKTVRRDAPKDRLASRVCKKSHPHGGLENANSKSKHSRSKSSKPKTTSSGAFDEKVENQSNGHKHTKRDTKSLASGPTVDESSDMVKKSKSEDAASDEAGTDISDPQTSLALPGFSSTDDLNMDSMPTEVLQMIWREVVLFPACHTFKLKRGDTLEEGSRWTVHLWPKDDDDSSAYQLWKRLLSLHNIGFQTAFRRFVKQIQPIAMRVIKAQKAKFKAAKFYKVMAAIDTEQDLVILEMDRGQPLPWFEHTGRGHRGMNPRVIRDRMGHFRRVAIHYKFGQTDCAWGGAFECLCHGANQPHDGYNACPLTLASFLDLFPSLEHFYFVVESRLVWHKKFAAEYRDQVAKNDFRCQITHPGGPKAIGKEYTLSRFFDTKFEYLQQAPFAYLDAMGRADSTRANSVKDRRERPPSPWIGDGSAQQCLVETRQFYKSQKGNEDFLQPLEKRAKVRFGVLIPYLLKDDGKNVTS
ncbi:hypothetical protein N0V93_008140 [Gnomoniopsis smithogilvyi]|uniref:Uncharacterized protein n=1 Tax=Gnomoniopsis smithogilvyi TaxID=1191159 RepID=A0A9W8YL59_9PEZI|nr:hypothetical protein N0V93_008140 [Gnomoniopsis smithogilvyi]